MRATTTRFGMATAGLLLLLPLLLLSACDAGSPPESASTNLSATSNTAAPSSVARVNFTDAPDLDEVAELDWSALIPADWRPEQLLENLTADGESLDAIGDEDPRAGLIMDKIKALWEEAPLVEALDGQRVKLPGFVVPLEFDFDELSEFLLVPYYGACIHVPPPPANQIVHVILPEGKTYHASLFDMVWVTGVLRIDHFSSEMANAGYRLEALALAPYQAPYQ